MEHDIDMDMDESFHACDSAVGNSSPFLTNRPFHDFPKIYPSQTKILEGRTNFSECAFEVLFKGVSILFGLRIVENCFENTFGKVGLDFQNLRLGSIKLLRECILKRWFDLPKSSFGRGTIVFVRGIISSSCREI